MRKLSLKELKRVDVETFKKKDKSPIILVLDNIRSALNVGSAFRTADAFALQGIYLCGITAKPPHREILKTAIGASASVDWTYFEHTKDAIQDLKSKGFHVLGVEQTTESTLLQNFSKETHSKFALIFGNEVKGVSDEALAELDGCIEIPQYGTKHSLNISVSLGIVVWEVFRQLKF